MKNSKFKMQNWGAGLGVLALLLHFSLCPFNCAAQERPLKPSAYTQGLVNNNPDAASARAYLGVGTGGAFTNPTITGGSQSGTTNDALTAGYLPYANASKVFADSALTYNSSNTITLSGSSRPQFVVTGTDFPTRLGRVAMFAGGYFQTLNAYFDGAAWQRDDVALGSGNLNVGANALRLRLSPAGSGAITWKDALFVGPEGIAVGTTTYPTALSNGIHAVAGIKPTAFPGDSATIVPFDGNGTAGNMAWHFFGENAATTGTAILGATLSGAGFPAAAMTANSTWHVQGSFATALTNYSGNQTLTSGDSLVVVDTTGGNVQITLPTAVGIKGRVYRIKKTAAGNTLNIATTSSQTIDGAASPLAVTTLNAVTAVVSDNVNWLIF